MPCIKMQNEVDTSKELSSNERSLNFLRILVILCMFHGIHATILRLPCALVAEFIVYESGKRLKNHVIRVDHGLNDVQCMVKCVEHKQCRSYNINTNNLICEISSKAHADEGAHLANDPEWVYRSTDFSSKLLGPTCKRLEPCEKGFFCRDTCTPPHYECLDCDKDPTGLYCNAKIDQNGCKSNPCKNLGKCINLSATYKCECKAGYTGRNCEIDVDECYSLPCLNGAACLQGNGKFTCHCPAGYTGTVCDTDINECASNPCQNGATCVDLVNGYNCSCVSGFSGPDCDIATCWDLKIAGYPNGMYSLRFPGGKHEVYCEMEINGGGYTFFSNSTIPMLNQDDLAFVFKKNEDVLLKLLNPDGTESYTVVKQYINTGGLSVQVNQYSGYNRPRDYGIDYLFLGLLPKASSIKGDTQGLKSNGENVTFTNCDGNANNFFAFYSRPNNKEPNYNGHYETHGIAVKWRSTAIQHSTRMPREYFLFTALGFGGCGCYTESGAWSRSTHPALGTAIGVR